MTRVVLTLQQPAAARPALTSLAAPDVRVVVEDVHYRTRQGPRDYVRITVQNHSAFVIHALPIHCMLGPCMLISRHVDDATGNLTGPFALPPGSAHTLHIDQNAFPLEVGDDAVAIVTDQIGRSYATAPGMLATAVARTREATVDRLRHALVDWGGNPMTIHYTLSEAHNVGMLDHMWSALSQTAQALPWHLVELWCEGLAEFAERSPRAPLYRASLVEAAAASLGTLEPRAVMEWFQKDPDRLMLRAWLLLDVLESDQQLLESDRQREQCRTWFVTTMEKQFLASPASLLSRTDVSTLVAIWLESGKDAPSRWFQAVLEKGRASEVSVALRAFHIVHESGEQYDLATVQELAPIDLVTQAFDKVSRHNHELAIEILPARTAFYAARYPS